MANVCNWLRVLEGGCLVGLYCSDVSGAFDGVRRERIVRELRMSGLDFSVVKFLENLLLDRGFVLAANGNFSEEQMLNNSMFQGTVLGPPLWNMFYEDAYLSMKLFEFVEVVFANDFNCWRQFAAGSSFDGILRLCENSGENLSTNGAPRIL